MLLSLQTQPQGHHGVAREDFGCLQLSKWPTWAVVFASMELLLEAHPQYASCAIYLRTISSGKCWKMIRPQIDHHGLASDYLSRVERSCPDVVSLDAFSLHISCVEIDHSQDLSLLSHSDVLANAPLKHTIHCTTRKCADSLSLALESHGDGLLSSTRFRNQMLHITKELVFAANAEKSLKDLDMISDFDRHDIQRWSQQSPTLVESTIHDIVKQKVLANPQAPAIDSWDGSFTYEELDFFSSNASFALLEAGVKPGDVVPLCFEKSRWTPVALLGVLKAGCAFLLIDVTHPTARIQTLIEQAKAEVLLTSAEQEERARHLVARTIVVSAATVGTAPNNMYLPQVEPHAVAAIVFTSGTTGTPKGMQLEHRSICSSLLAISKLCAFNEKTRYYQFSSNAFDAAFGDMLMALMNGGCICMPSEADRLSRLAESIRQFKANATLLTPTVLRLLKPEDVPCFTTLISGGERVTRDLVSTWGKKLRFIIVYGPAETTVACICKHAVVAADDEIKIGFPVNSRAWIVRLDDPYKLAPVGAQGELVCESPGVARGYINNDIDNARLYLDAPPWSLDWNLGPTSRCYRTGDLAQYANDGEIIFLGRRDRQVKLRGQRIELEDIETKLQLHNHMPGSRIVLEVLDTNGTDNLVAFISDAPIPRSGNIAVTGQAQQQIDYIRERIADELPSYMWPVAWLPVTKYETTSTGKLDRRKLQDLGKAYFDNMPAETCNTAELTPLESTLAEIWKQLLHYKQDLTPDSHFFLLGGDSLRAMKLVTLMKQVGYNLITEAVFKQPTLAAMAKAMSPVSATVVRVDSKMSSPSLGPVPHEPEVAMLDLCLRQLGANREDVEDVFPCTPLQEALFSLSLMKTSLYFSQFVFRLPADLDVWELRRACDSAIRAFPVLRTAIVSTPSGVAQAVLRTSSAWNVAEQDLTSFLGEDKKQPFQSGRPLARFSHVKGKPGSSHLVWTLHHAIYDGWSMQLTIDYIRQEYRKPGATLSVATSFKGFVQHCKDLNKDASSQYWKEQLRGAPTPSFPVMPTTGYLATDGTCLRHSMATPSVSTHGATITILARASWALLLSEYEGSEDLVFGNPLHGRNALPLDLQNVVGPTIATLPIRVKINQEQTVSSFLDRLQKQFSGMIQHELFGLSQIMALGEDIKSAAAFRTLLIVQVKDETTTDLTSIRLEEVERSLHEYPLVLTLMPGGSQIELVLTFDSNVITSAHASRIMKSFEQTFGELCRASGDRKLRDIDVTSNDDKTTIFRWNARSHHPFNVCVHEMIQEQVKRSPQAEAIYTDRQSLDYGSLGMLSDNLAAELTRSGVKPGKIVGILFEKSIWAPVCMLAIIKAGCAYAPLAPSDPKARLEAVASDAKIDTVLCSPAQHSKALELNWRSIVIDEAIIRSFPEAVIYDWNVATHESLLYMITTSGTTGTPKCFTVKHKSFATGALARAPHIKRDCDSRVLQFAPYVFDPSVEDILTTLMFGGCICVPSEDDIMGDLSAFIRRSGANFANITPSVAHTLDQENLPSLKALLLSGEAPDQGLIGKWTGKTQLMNGYGPSECSVKCAINCRLSSDDARNIGYSVGTNVWVLKPSNHNLITPLGALGELVIESPNLAEGYLNRPEVNKEKFIQSPHWLTELRHGRTTRLYKSGDLVRYKEDGSIVYSGRGDLQLKINGQRLEGEEVRKQVQQCFDGMNVLVDTVKFETQKAELLVAYLAAEGGRAETLELDPELQTHIVAMKAPIMKELKRVLPKYMVPSAFVAVSCIPTTVNGKANRRVLKTHMQQQRLKPTFMLSDKDDVQTTVETPSEKLLHDLWQKLIGLEPEDFGANAHFFDVAGSSLMAIRLSAALRDRGWVLTPRQIMEYPVLSDMAIHMKAAQHTNKTLPLQKFSLLDKIGCATDTLKASLATYGIPEHDVENAYPCTRQQQRYIEGEMLAPGGTTYRHIIRLPRDVNLERFEAALQRIVSVNDILRTRIVQVGPHIVQVVLKESLACARVDSFFLIQTEDSRISWAFGQPQSRFRIVDDGKGGKYLVWSSAHVIFDGWTRKQMLNDLDDAYHHDSLPLIRPQAERFIEYVYNQQMDKAGRNLVAELERKRFCSYWDASQIKQSPRISHFLSLDVNFQAALPKGLSYPTVMLTAWAIVAAYIESHNDFFFTLLLGGRDAALAGIDTLMAPTSTTAPLAISMNHDSTIREAVEAVHRSVLDAGSIQHSVKLGDRINALLASAPLLMVHPPEDYEDQPTKTLGLVRTRAEMVAGMADAFCMNFSLRPENAGVDLLLAIDEKIFSPEKAERYLSCFEHVVAKILAPRGLNPSIETIDLSTVHTSSSITTRTRYMS
jgi:amino acid adenylation domain-containing protein